MVSYRVRLHIKHRPFRVIVMQQLTCRQCHLPVRNHSVPLAGLGRGGLLGSLPVCLVDHSALGISAMASLLMHLSRF
eukprot:9707014-Alexandrium_andersonii.AAC.1